MMEGGAERGRRCWAENRNICITKRDRNYPNSNGRGLSRNTFIRRPIVGRID